MENKLTIKTSGYNYQENRDYSINEVIEKEMDENVSYDSDKIYELESKLNKLTSILSNLLEVLVEDKSIKFPKSKLSDILGINITELKIKE